MSDFFENRVENLEPEEDKKKSSATAMKFKDKKSTKKNNWEDSNLSIIESCEESSVDHRAIKKLCILHRKCSHPTDKC